MTFDRSGRTQLAAAVAALSSAVLLAAGVSASGGALRVALVLGIGAGVFVGVQRGGRGIAAVAALVGAVALAIGVGFVPHLFEAPFSVRGIGAAGVVLGGAGLIVFGTAAATAGVQRLARIPSWLVALVVVALTLAVVGPAVAVVNVPDSTASRTAAAPPLDAEPVALPTPDGVTLAAWWVPGTNGAAVLVAGLDHRIAVLGLSMGGEEAIGAATDPRIVAVVAEGATARRAADKDWLSDVHGWRGAVQERIEQLQYGLTDLLTDAPRPTVLRDAVVAAEEWERRVVGFLDEHL